MSKNHPQDGNRLDYETNVREREPWLTLVGVRDMCGMISEWDILQYQFGEIKKSSKIEYAYGSLER